MWVLLQETFMNKVPTLAVAKQILEEHLFFNLNQKLTKNWWYDQAVYRTWFEFS